MHWLQTLDTRLFHLVNPKLQNSFCDWLMPFASGNPYFFPVLFFAGVWLLWKGGTRVRVMLLMLLIILPLGDTYICNTIKHATLRLRPFAALDGMHQLVSAGRNNSMPSSHAANWAAATMIAFIYLRRRSLWFMLPLAFTVSFSRVYNGVHYPGDVLAGWILGAGYAALGVWLLDQLWRWLGRKWFPLWQQRLPSLLAPPSSMPPASSLQPPAFNFQSSALEQHWLRLGYVFIAALLFVRLRYIASGVIDLSEDETYYWLWSKHLALSYYSKPPLVALTHWLGTALWGDTAFGVRFFSPVIAAILGFIVLRFLAREANARTAFLLLVAVNATPLLAVGGTLMTIDPLSVLFWTAATIAGWRAVREDSTSRDWLWVGLWLGLGFLSKYTALFQLLCWAVFFALWKPARSRLRRPGPWLALLVSALCALPVLVWNARHGWITVAHVAGDAHAGRPWSFHLPQFLASEFALLNPVFFVLTVWAAFAFWRRGKKTPLQIYLFSMGAPLFLVYLLWSCRSRVLPNWIAPSVLPLFCLAAIYWTGHGARAFRRWLQIGFALGLTAVVLLHDTDLIRRISGRSLPLPADPLSRVRGWKETAALVAAARRNLLAEGRDVFMIGGHYGITSQLAFHLPDQITNVYCLVGDLPLNQFYFWPGYAGRRGQNAVFVTELVLPAPLPPILTNEFATVTSLGVQPVSSRGRDLRWLQIFECRDLR